MMICVSLSCALNARLDIHAKEAEYSNKLQKSTSDQTSSNSQKSQTFPSSQRSKTTPSSPKSQTSSNKQTSPSGKKPPTNPQALKAFERGDFVLAVNLLKNPQSAGDYILLARTQLAIRDGDAAYSYSKASELSPKPASLVLQALCNLNYGKSEDAYRLMKVAYADYPDNADVMSTFGRSLCTVQQSDKGIELQRKARDWDPSSTICSDNLAAMARLNFASGEAIKSLSREIEMKPHSVPPRLKRAIVYSESGHIPECMKDFEAALKENPDCQYAYYQRATVYRNLKQYEKMLADLERSEKCSSKSILVSQKVLRLKVDVEEHLHKVSSAAADARKLTGQYKNIGLSRGMRADIFHQVSLLEKQNKFTEALEALQPLIKRYPDRSEVITARARIDLGLKKFKSALSLADLLIARDNDMWEWHQIRGQALSGLGDAKSAADEFEKAKKLKSEYAELPAQYKELIK